jgi:hypothetical protein
LRDQRRARSDEQRILVHHDHGLVVAQHRDRFDRSEGRASGHRGRRQQGQVAQQRRQLRRDPLHADEQARLLDEGARPILEALGMRGRCLSQTQRDRDAATQRRGEFERGTGLVAGLLGQRLGGLVEVGLGIEAPRDGRQGRDQRRDVDFGLEEKVAVGRGEPRGREGPGWTAQDGEQTAARLGRVHEDPIEIADVANARRTHTDRLDAGQPEFLEDGREILPQQREVRIVAHGVGNGRGQFASQAPELVLVIHEHEERGGEIDARAHGLKARRGPGLLRPPAPRGAQHQSGEQDEERRRLAVTGPKHAR